MILRFNTLQWSTKLFFFCSVMCVVLTFVLKDHILIFFKPRINAPVITWRDASLRHILVNNTVSKVLEKKVRILCVVPSTADNEQTKARAVNNTWGARCNKLLFVFANHRSSFIHISVDIKEGRSALTVKSMEAFKFVHRHYANDFDFIVKADDDSYVILENLRFLLSNFDPKEPAYLGYHFKVLVHNGYMSGGGSYVLSKAALRMLVEEGLSKNGGCSMEASDEDVEVGRCMELLGVKPYITQDKFGRDAFHPQLIEEHMVGPMPWYLSHYPAVPVKAGPECCSQFSISFHYVPYDMMYIIHFLLYRINVYGTVHLPIDQLKDVFQKKVSKIKHKSNDEIFQIKDYRSFKDFIPQLNDQS